MTTTFDFGLGSVPAHHHKNGRGWVADTASVADGAYVGPNAQVSGQAQVYGEARVSGQARVYGEAQVYGEAYLHFGRGVTPSIASGDLWLNRDGTETVRLGCWTGTIADLRSLAASEEWPSGGNAEYRNRWRPSLLALADLCEAHLSAWGESGC